MNALQNNDPRDEQNKTEYPFDSHRHQRGGGWMECSVCAVRLLRLIRSAYCVCTGELGCVPMGTKQMSARLSPSFSAPSSAMVSSASSSSACVAVYRLRR